MTYRIRRKEAPANLQEVGRGPITEKPTGHIKGFGCYPKCNGKPLKGFKPENDIIRFGILKYYSDESCVEKRFE